MTFSHLDFVLDIIIEVHMILSSVRKTERMCTIWELGRGFCHQ